MLDLDGIVRNRPVATPSQLIRAWLHASGRIALVLVAWLSVAVMVVGIAAGMMFL